MEDKQPLLHESSFIEDDEERGGGEGSVGSPLIPAGSRSPKRTAYGSEPSSIDYEDALEAIAIGKFHYILLGLCGWANASDAVELMSISFVITTHAECELGLTDPKKGMLTASMFFGMMIGGWMWGSLADKYGRRQTLVVALVVNSFFGFLSAFSENYGQFLLFRILSGVGVGGSIPILFSYFCEFLPRSMRGKYVTGVAAFWMVGSILVAAMAWAVITPQECAKSLVPKNATLDEQCALEKEHLCDQYSLSWGLTSSWRIFLALCCLPALISAVLLCFAPESPRWFLTVDKFAQAENILSSMATLNKKEGFLPGTFSLAPLDIDPNRLDEANLKARYVGRDSLRDRVEYLTKSLRLDIFHVYSATAALFSKELRRNTTTLLSIWFIQCFGLYGLALWLPEYFKEGNVSDNMNIYEASFYGALSNLPGNIFCAWALEKWGRKITLASSLLLSGLSVFSILLITSSAGTVAFSCVFNAVSVSSWNALDILSAELFPTRLRGTAFGFLAAGGRVGAILGNITFGEVSGSNITLPLIVVGAALTACSLLVVLLPKTAGTSMH